MNINMSSIYNCIYYIIWNCKQFMINILFQVSVSSNNIQCVRRKIKDESKDHEVRPSYRYDQHGRFSTVPECRTFVLGTNQ